MNLNYDIYLKTVSHVSRKPQHWRKKEKMGGGQEKETTSQGEIITTSTHLFIYFNQRLASNLTRH
jgi:hypothetical protein